jgi:hypothetical protein
LTLKRTTVAKPYSPLELFGDGYPTWTTNAGKGGQRPSPSTRQAKRQRDAKAQKLRWHANHMASLAGNETATSIVALALADKLDACAPPRRPCLSGACPICMRAQQRWFAEDAKRVMRSLMRDPRYSRQVLSLVPELGRIRAGSLDAFEMDGFYDSIRDALTACGINNYKLGFDISLNQRAGVASSAVWQLQLSGFFSEPKSTSWRQELNAMLNPNGGVTRSVTVAEPDPLDAVATCGVNSTSGRRLRGDAWVELMLFLDRIGLERRLLISSRDISIPPLHSWNGLRLV